MDATANIYLTGMMGSGKTSVGRILARLVRFAFVDLDEALIREEKLSIADIFRSKGEPYFRDAESRILASVSTKIMQVISTGGGIILKPENVKLMRETGKIVYLRTSREALIKRLEGSSNRPLLAGEDWKKRVEELLSQRAGIYENAASLEIVTDGKTAEAVAAEIAEKIKV